MTSLPSTMPDGSKRVKVKASTNSSSGTPYCRPMEMAMAKLFIRLRKAAPSLCMRSEEHTSELQSLMRISYAVFCLKKKKTQKYNPKTILQNNKTIHLQLLHTHTMK